MLYISTWFIYWPARENSFYTPCKARQSIIPPWPLSCCCDMVTQKEHHKYWSNITYSYLELLLISNVEEMKEPSDKVYLLWKGFMKL